ncbi:MAG: hypothetical protein Q9170_003527 [Blastenia crenularia]
MLYLKLWWLLLPLNAFGHPLLESTHETTATSARLGPRHGDPVTQLDDPHAAIVVERRADSMIPRLRDFANTYMSAFRLPAEPKLDPTMPVLIQAADISLVNQSFGVYGSYNDVDVIKNFDFEYPPYTSKKIIKITGSMDTETTETDVYVEIMGWPLGDYKGNLDDGMRVDVNIVLAKGFIEIKDVQGRPKDSIFLTVDLHLPFRQHLDKTWLLFRLPHSDRPVRPKPAAVAATA